MNSRLSERCTASFVVAVVKQAAVAYNCSDDYPNYQQRGFVGFMPPSNKCSEVSVTKNYEIWRNHEKF